MNNKLHAGLYNTIVDQAADHFTGIPIKWDYDITEQRRSIMQRAKDLFLNNTLKTPKHQKSSNG